MKKIFMKIFAVFAVLATLSTATVGQVITGTEPAVAGMVGVVIGAIITVLITVALMNTVVNNTKVVTSNTNIDASTKSLVTLLPFGVALVAFISLFAFLI